MNSRQGSKPQNTQPSQTERNASDEEAPRFTEGERGPSPIEGTGDDGVRRAIETEHVGEAEDAAEEQGKHTEATMPPGTPREDKRNTM